MDKCLGEVVDAGLEEGYAIIVTGDHYNVESMLYRDGEPNPSHGINPVPFILIIDDQELRNVKFRRRLRISSVAPTILQLMEIEKPPAMTGKNIII